MQFYPHSALGFEITDELAEKMGLLEEYTEWKEDYDDTAFAEAFEKKLKPPKGYLDLHIQFFEYERNGYVQGLEGFNYDKTYVYFGGKSESDKGWKAFIRKLETKFPSLKFESATWCQFS